MCPRECILEVQPDNMDTKQMLGYAFIKYLDSFLAKYLYMDSTRTFLQERITFHY